MDEPRSHYQVSFTSRQGLAAFVGLVAAIVLAYFLGLMTGLAGAGTEARQASGTAASAGPALKPTPEAAPEPAFPAPVLGVSGKTPSARTSGPSPTPAPVATPAIQLFSDRASSEPTHTPAPAVKPAPGKAPGKAAPAADFWVQVDSLSSKDQAEARKRGLAAAGFKASVFPGAGPRGPVYRVRVGPYATREEAERGKEAVARKAKVTNSWIVSPGQ